MALNPSKPRIVKQKRRRPRRRLVWVTAGAGPAASSARSRAGPRSAARTRGTAGTAGAARAAGLTMTPARLGPVRLGGKLGPV